MTEKNRRGPVWNQNQGAAPKKLPKKGGKKDTEKLGDRLARKLDVGSSGFAISIIAFGVVALYIGTSITGVLG